MTDRIYFSASITTIKCILQFQPWPTAGSQEHNNIKNYHKWKSKSSHMQPQPFPTVRESAPGLQEPNKGKSWEVQTGQEEWKTHIAQRLDAFPFQALTLPAGHMQPELLKRENSLHLS